MWPFGTYRIQVSIAGGGFGERTTPPIDLFFVIFMDELLINFATDSTILNARCDTSVTVDVTTTTITTLYLSYTIVGVLRGNGGIISGTTLQQLCKLFCLFSNTLSVDGFTLFSSTRLRRRTDAFLLNTFVVTTYACTTSLKFRTVSHFSTLIFILAIVNIFKVTTTSTGGFRSVGLFPFVRGSDTTILGGTTCSLYDADRVPLLFTLQPQMGKGTNGPFYFTVILSYLLDLLVTIITYNILNGVTSISTCPIFRLSRLTHLNANREPRTIFATL